MNRYSFILLIMIIALASCQSKIDFDTAPTPPVDSTKASDLFISELATAINTDNTTGGTRNHYVEIYNGTKETVNLLNYAIGYQASTDLSTLAPWSFPTGNYIILNGALAHGTCYVIASPQASTTAVPKDTTWGTTSTASANASVPLQLSGNSAIALLKKDGAGTIMLGAVAYKIVDIFGSPQVPRLTTTGSTSTRNNFIWPIAGETDTRNRTFIRKSNIKDPTTNWEAAMGTSASNSQWELSIDRQWSYTNVGKHEIK